MSNILGTNIAALVAPFTTDDTYPTHDSVYGLGGWREVASIEDRNAIPVARTRAGMVVYVQGDQPYLWNGTSWVALLSSTPRTAEICYTFDGGGAVLTSGKEGQIYIPLACTILGWTITSDLQGSAVVDVLTATYSGPGLPTTASIAGSDKPTLSDSTNAIDTTLSGWGTTAISSGTYLRFNINSVSAITHLDVSLIVTTSG